MVEQWVNGLEVMILVISKVSSIHGFLSRVYASLCAYEFYDRNKPTIQIMKSLA